MKNETFPAKIFNPVLEGLFSFTSSQVMYYVTQALDVPKKCSFCQALSFQS